MRILLSRLVNAKEDTDLVETLRALFMTPLDDADLGMWSVILIGQNTGIFA